MCSGLFFDIGEMFGSSFSGVVRILGGAEQRTEKAILPTQDHVLRVEHWFCNQWELRDPINGC
jgi:hypothetical protein